MTEFRDDKNMPKIPLIVIDESYAHAKMGPQRTWLYYGTDAEIAESEFLAGKSSGKMACILAAGVLRKHGNEMTGHFSTGSIQVWDRAATGNPAGRPSSDVVAPEDEKEEYHGNVDSALFERWFRDLCIRIHKAYGRCLMLMDGARSHKRRVDPPPPSSDRKAVIQQWLTEHNVTFDPKFTKPDLMDLVRENKGRAHYVVVDIAEEYGHHVLFTPPYHPELQPIEKIWAVVKNYLRTHPITNPSDLVPTVNNIFNHYVHPSSWLGAYASVCEHEIEYTKRAEKQDAFDSDDEVPENELFEEEGMLVE